MMKSNLKSLKQGSKSAEIVAKNYIGDFEEARTQI